MHYSHGSPRFFDVGNIIILMSHWKRGEAPSQVGPASAGHLGLHYQSSGSQRPYSRVACPTKSCQALWSRSHTSAPLDTPMSIRRGQRLALLSFSRPHDFTPSHFLPRMLISKKGTLTFMRIIAHRTTTARCCTAGASVSHKEMPRLYLPGNLTPDQEGTGMCCTEGLRRGSHRPQR